MGRIKRFAISFGEGIGGLKSDHRTQMHGSVMILWSEIDNKKKT